MGRRKKEPASTHRANIAAVAGQLFAKKGIVSTTVDEIARVAGYSKATVYVYFKNKEEIVGMLILESMKKLHGYISLALTAESRTRARYDAVCYALLQYQEQFPFYFHIVLQEINVDFEKPDVLEVDREIFTAGEQINEMLAQFVREGIAAGDIRPGIPVLPTVFSFWAMMSGLIQMAAGKEQYIEKAMKISKRDFLQYGFDTLYASISTGEVLG